MIQGREFLKKSFWRKINNAFNLSVYIIKEERIHLEGGDIVWDFTCEAVAKNGRKSCGTGSCSLYEKSDKPNTWHNTRSTAETRAYNRAVSNLVGGGEVSAEEMLEENHHAEKTSKPDVSMPKERELFPDKDKPVEKYEPKAGERMSSLKQQGMIHALLSGFFPDKDDQAKWLMEMYSVAHTKELTIKQASDCIQELQALSKGSEK